MVTSLSCQVEDLWKRVLAGESGVHTIRLFDTTGHKVHFAGESTIGRPATTCRPRKPSASIASRSSPWSPASTPCATPASTSRKVDPFRAGVILGSGIGGLHEIETQVERLLAKGPDKVSAFTIPKLMLNAASGQVSIEFGLRGPNYAVATACASATNAIGDAFKAIQYDDADVMVTGGSEAAITPMGISGFANMRALSERNDEPQRASRPFDRDRDGFVLAEGAGMLVFEELEHASNAVPGSMPKCSATAPVPTPATSRSPTKGHRRRASHEAGPAMTPKSIRPTSATSTPTAPARRWAIRPKRRPSSRSSASTPRS